MRKFLGENRIYIRDLTTMNIDDLVNLIPEEKLRADLSHWVNEWKRDNSDMKGQLRIRGKLQAEA